MSFSHGACFEGLSIINIIETQTIYPIPAGERHGRARDLFTIWFGSNIMILTIATGALATTKFGLPLGMAVLAILAGNLVGAVFMALHAAQGPTLGVPQMLQTRGQFGSVGAVFVVGLVMFMYLGFVASNLVLGGQSLHVIAASVDERTGIVLISVASVIAAIVGYDLIHAYGRWMSWISGVALLLCFVWVLGVRGLPVVPAHPLHLTTAGFFGMLSVGALWQIAYAPYVSDYSRYMPVDGGGRSAFWASYWGCALGSALPMLLGALLGLGMADGNLVAALNTALQPISAVVIALFTIGLGAPTAMNIYCGVLSAVTVGQTFRPQWRPGKAARIGWSLAFMLAALAMAVYGAADFLGNYESFLSVLLCVLAPWTAINLVDFYLVRHGQYDVASFFRADGGIYGRYNGPALFCYVVGILIQVPFLATHLYTGPLAAALGGVDVSWVAAILLISPLYYLLAARAATAPAALSGG